MPRAIVSRQVFGLETLIGADMEPVALDVHPGLREKALPLASVETEVKRLEQLCRNVDGEQQGKQKNDAGFLVHFV